MDSEQHINHAALKATSAIAAAGVAGYTWSEIAAFLAATYTFILICEWMWKRVIRPLGKKWFPE